MKPIQIIGATALYLIFGLTAPAGTWGGQDQQQKDKSQEKDKPPQHDEHKQDQHHQHDQQQEQHRQQQEQQHHQQQQQQQQQQQRQQQEQHNREQQQHAQQQQHEQQQHEQRQQNDRQRQQEEQNRQQRARQYQEQQQQQQVQQQQRAQEQERQRHSQPVYTTSSQRGEHHTEQREIWQRDRAGNWQSDHHEWRERGGYHGYRIPENRYRGYFGPSHFFRLSFLPVVYVSGRPRFEYEGYWFVLEDPWPPEWSDDWYDSDDMYVEYFDDGYYLCDHRHPGYRVAISVFVG